MSTILTVFESIVAKIRAINGDTLVARWNVGEVVNRIETDKAAELLTPGESKRLEQMLTATGYASSERAKCKRWFLKGPAKGKLAGNYLSWAAAYELFTAIADFHPMKREAIITALGSTVEVADKVTAKLVPDLVAVIQSGEGVTETGKASTPEYSYSVDGEKALQAAVVAQKARIDADKAEAEKRKAESEVARVEAEKQAEAEAEKAKKAAAKEAAEREKNHPTTIKVVKIAAMLADLQVNPLSYTQESVDGFIACLTEVINA